MNNEQMIDLMSQVMAKMTHAMHCRFSLPQPQSWFDDCCCGVGKVMEKLFKAKEELEKGDVQLLSEREVDEIVRKEILTRMEFEKLAFYLGGEAMREAAAEVAMKQKSVTIAGEIFNLPPVKPEEPAWPLK
jgi:hypothetical protein